MAEEYDAKRTHECEEPVVREEGVEGGVVEVKDRGIFDFAGKKEEKEKEKEKEEEKEGKHGHHHHHHGHHHGHHHCHGEEGVKEEVIAAEFEGKVKVEEGEVKEEKKKEKKKKHKLGGSHSSSSSSSSDEEEDEEKKKKKKEKKEKRKMEKEEKKKKKEEQEKLRVEGTAVAVEKCDEEVFVPPAPAAVEEKKGFLEKIKGKIPVVGGQAKKSEEVAPPPPPACDVAAMEATPPPPCVEGEAAGKEKKGFLEKIKEKIPGYHQKSPEEEKEKEKEKEIAST